MKQPGLKDIVVSLAGHDGGKLFAVTGTAGGKLLLCDGKNRRLENPKCKSPKHVRVVLRGAALIGTDKEIRKTLALAAEQIAASKEENRLGER